MFRLFPNETVLEIFNKTSIEGQARLAQVDKRCNEISKDKTLELSKYKTECTVHSVSHIHVVLQKKMTNPSFFVLPGFFAFHGMKGNKKVFEYQIGSSLAKDLRAAMEGDTSSTIKKFESTGYPELKKPALLLQEALEEENRSTFKNRK